MSATTEQIHSPAAIKRIPASVKIIAAILTPVILTVIAFYIYGLQIRNEERIYPNIFIAGIDVSGLTQYEALQSLGLPAYEERSANAKVMFTFPDDSNLVITGNDVKLQHNARDMINEAYSTGRGHGVFMDTISYLQRQNAEKKSFDIDFFLNTDMLNNAVGVFTDDYNSRLNASDPEIYEDRIVFTKGAGHVTADAPEISDLAYIGLFESLESGEPVEIIYTLPETNKFVTELLEIRDLIFVQMVSSEFDPETASASESAVGVNFDPMAAVELIKGTESGKTATFYLDFTNPEYHQEYLDSLLFRDLLGERTTWAHGNSNRLTNISLASEAINDHILLSGEEFSFNGVVGARTTERGYKIAPALSRDETIMSVGGGVCQVSSTIFAAIRTSDINVTDQRKHSKPVPYLPWGHDATVFYPWIDFKFENNTNYPMRLELELDERNLTVRVWGTIIDDFPREAGWND